MSESDSLALLAEIDGAAIGMVVASITEEKASLLNPLRYCRVSSIGVAAAHRNNGIGRLLMARTEEWARSRGAVDIRLNVWEFNSRAMEFYRELGYGVRSISMGKSVQLKTPNLKDRVVTSLENPFGDRCVDIFVRGDESFGFEEFRRDPEAGASWQSLSKYSRLVFASDKDALAAARKYVAWLSQIVA